MIIEILEFGMNMLNGPFYDTPEAIAKDSGRWALLAPIAALYVAVVGAGTFLISYVLCHLLLLYGIIHRFGHLLNATALAYAAELRRGGVVSTPLLLERAVATQWLPFGVAAAVAALLYAVHHIHFRRSVSMARRVIHAAVRFITHGLLVYTKSTAPLEATITANLLLTKVATHVYCSAYMKRWRRLDIMLFSYLGSYYFLRCAHSLPGLAGRAIRFLPDSHAAVPIAPRLAAMNCALFIGLWVFTARMQKNVCWWLRPEWLEKKACMAVHG